VHGGTKTPVEAASSRFIEGLPADNAVPLILAHAVERDRRPLPDPLYANWSPSDRPPLQTGIYLSTTSVLGLEKSELQYSVVSSLLQSLWLLGIWAFFAAARTSRALAALTTAAILFSGFTLMNTFYVWPKLLSAAYLLVVAAIFLTSSSSRIVKERGCATVLGLCVAGALLAHNGAFIALIALVAYLLLRRQVPSWTLVVPAAIVAALVVAPWIAYQKVVDPPGDKLLKLQVAGIPNIDTPRSLTHELVHHYRRIGPEKAITNKLDNLINPFRGEDELAREAWRVVVSTGKGDHARRDQAIHDLRWNQFFYLLPTLGILALGPILFALSIVAEKLGLRPGRSLRDAPHEWPLLIFLALIIFFWSLILFGPNYTFLHQGTYITPLLAFIVCTAFWWRLSPLVTTALVALQAAATLYLYNEIPLGAPTGLFTARPGLFAVGGGASMAVLTICSLASLVALLASGVTRRPRDPLFA
jgi:MFS family permease